MIVKCPKCGAQANVQEGPGGRFGVAHTSEIVSRCDELRERRERGDTSEMSCSRLALEAARLRERF